MYLVKLLLAELQVLKSNVLLGNIFKKYKIIIYFINFKFFINFKNFENFNI